MRLFGYSLTQSAYLCLDPSSKIFWISRHVQFHESTFSFSSLSNVSSSNSASSSSRWLPSVSAIFGHSILLPSTAQPLSSDPSHDETPPAETKQPQVIVEHINPATDSLPVQYEPSSSSSYVVLEQSLPPQNTHSMVTRGKNNIIKPNSQYALIAYTVTAST